MLEYEQFSNQIDNKEIADTFKSLSIACQKHTKKLQNLINNYDMNNLS
jgi:rubrerythrin